MTHDNLSDMLTRIRNANAVGMQTVSFPTTRINRQIAHLLETEGFIDSFRDYPAGSLMLQLKYKGKKPSLTSLRRISKPGRQVYVNHKDVPKVLGGMGIAILSTSQGIVTDRVARSRRLGGEILCYIW
uniref:Small ribosomal subunit protein uS8c n=1 Tax=Nephroselmis astigmatica TaxID=259378 RepID=A0A088CIJ2_9CHLO|nr:ribosomal protein S8 [Nephroselmis astigmatica]AID67735.1 ribosomal protein S8 [Nephroselmis astigmatica]